MLLTRGLQARPPSRPLRILMPPRSARDIDIATTPCVLRGVPLRLDQGRSLWCGWSSHSGGQTTRQGTQTVVELTWQTADARLTLQTDSPAMVEAAEWSAAVSPDPPPARQDRSMAAAQVADRVAGLLLVLESESSPAVASAIESILQPLVTAHGDAVLCDLIEGIMQAMSCRGISEHRQRSMVTMLMFSLADPTAPIRMASARPGSHTLSPTLWLRSSCAISGCVRSYLMETPMPATRGQWLSCRCNRALFDVRFCQGSWYIHACSIDRCTQLAEHAKCGHRQDMHGVCVVQRRRRASWCVLHDGLRLHLHVGIQSLPRRVGVAQPRCPRQASTPGAVSSFCVAYVGCHSLNALCSLQQYTFASATRSCTAFTPWSLSHVECRVMGVHPMVIDGRASSLSVCPTRPVSFCEEDNSSGSWSDSIGHERFTSLSGIHFWELAGARAPGAWLSSDQMRDYLSRLAQASLGVAISFGLPTISANSSNCSQSLLFTGVGSCGILLHRLQGTSNRLVPPVHLRSIPARRSRIQLRRFGDQHANDLLRVHSSGFQDWSRRPSTRSASGSLSVCSIGLGVDLLLRLLLSDACSTLTPCHPRIAGLRSALVTLVTRVCLKPTIGRHSGSRCYRASWMVAVEQGLSNRSMSGHCYRATAYSLGRPHFTLVRPYLSGVALCREAVDAAVDRCMPLYKLPLSRCRCSKLRCPSPCPAHLGVLSSVITAGGITPCGGHRGRRPHTSPALARSKLRPGKQECQASSTAPLPKSTQQPLQVPHPVPLRRLQLLLRLPRLQLHPTPM